MLFRVVDVFFDEFVCTQYVLFLESGHFIFDTLDVGFQLLDVAINLSRLAGKTQRVFDQMEILRL